MASKAPIDQVPCNEESFASLFTFEPGDVTIQVEYKGKEVVGKASSVALCLGSRVWKKFIYPPWAPSQKTSSAIEGPTASKPALCAPPIVELGFREDDGDALLLLLCIAHLQFKHIPLSITTELLHEIAVLCDLYDCVELLKPWNSSWFLGKDTTDSPRWLFSAWAFGRHEIFREWATTMARLLRANGTIAFQLTLYHI